MTRLLSLSSFCLLSLSLVACEGLVNVGNAPGKPIDGGGGLPSGASSGAASPGGSSGAAGSGGSSGSVTGSSGGSSGGTSGSSSGATDSGATMDSGASDSGATLDGGTVLTGTHAFAVHDSLVSTQEPESQCGYQGTLSDGSYASLSVFLTGVNVSDAVCGDAGAPDTSASPIFIDIQVKSPSYAPTGHVPDAGPPTPITPGTYAVGFEGLPDDDLCMSGGALVLLDLRSFGVDGGGANTIASALSGSVTLVTVGHGRVAGSFDVMLAAYLSSGFDTKNTTHLTGAFDATSCPGTMQ